MATGLEPAFASGRPLWPMAGMALADLEPDDPDLAIPHGALQNGVREAPERRFAANHNDQITHQPAEPLGPKPSKTPDLKRKWKLALLASCIFHVAAALVFIQINDEAVQVEGADFAGIASLGNASADQSEAGENSIDVTMVTMLDAVPVDTVEAEAVPVDEVVEETVTAQAVTSDVETVKPVEETPVQPIDETKAEQVQPTERVETTPVESQTAAQAERVEAEPVENMPAPAVAETVPEVLATDRAELVDDDNFVQQPAKAQAAETVEAAEAEQLESARVKPVEEAKPAQDVKPKPQAEAKAKPVERKAEPAKPAREEKKPAAEKKTAKPKKAEGRKVAEKAEEKTKKSGNRGNNQTEARRGQADGRETGDNQQASRGGSKNGKVGNAAVSNYPGKVRSKLARAARSIRAKGSGEVVVAFAVNSSGGVRSARVARSSGIASVDQAALQAVSKASPFPPIPDGAGRSTWEFSVPLAFKR